MSYGERNLLDKSTIESYYFHIRNPKDTKGYGYSLWVRHKNGVEYPFIDADPFTTINSSDPDFGLDSYITRSDEFDELISFAVAHTLITRNSIDVNAILPDKMPDQERWLIENICRFLAMGSMSYELMEFLERVLDDEPLNAVKKVDWSQDESEVFVE